MNNETDREWPDPKPRYSDHLPLPQFTPFRVRVIGGSSLGAGLIITSTALVYHDPIGQFFGLCLLAIGLHVGINGGAPR